MADNEIIIDVKARLDNIDKSLNSIEKKAETTGSNVGKSFKVGAAVAVAAVAAITAAVVKMRAVVIDAATKQEDAVNALNQSLASAGTYSAEASRGMQEWAAALQRSTIYGDEVILQQTALARNFARSNEEAKRLTEAAVELSAATGMSLDAAVKNLGKTFSGLTGELGESLPIIKTLTAEQLKAGAALQLITDRFSGSAAAQIRTYSGAQKQLSNTFGDLLEQIGFLITRSPSVIATFNYLSGMIRKATEAVKEFAESGGMGRILVVGADVAKFFVSVLGPVFEVAYNWVARLGQQFGLLAGAIGQLLSGEFAAAAETTKELFKTTFDFKALFNTSGTDAAVAFIEGFQQTAASAPTEQVIEPFKNNVQATVDTFEGISWAGFVNGFRMSVEQMRTAAQQLMGQLKQTVIGGVAGAFSSFGTALVKGENAFAAFGKAILGMFGDLAMQLGQFYLLLGIGNLWLNPGAAAGQLAAGAGLLILGGVLKGLAGGGGAAPAGATATGGGTEAAPAGETLTSNLQPEAQGPGTQVTVNVQGNILDRRETGLELAQILNESFSSNGAVIARGGVV